MTGVSIGSAVSGTFLINLTQSSSMERFTYCASLTVSTMHWRRYRVSCNRDNLIEARLIGLQCFGVGRDSSVGIATRYVLDGPRIESR